jgi:hypothetical protein
MEQNQEMEKDLDEMNVQFDESREELTVPR